MISKPGIVFPLSRVVRTALALVTAAALLLGPPARAQSLAGLRIGDDISTTQKLGGPPSATDQMGPFTIDIWSLPDGNDISVRSDADTGKIVFLETDFGNKQPGTMTDDRGFRFSPTKLADIRKKLGNSGFVFEENVM